MTTEEDQLNAEIARLEVELEQARLESQLKHLQAQLALTEGEGGDVVEEWAEDEDYEEYEDEEVTEEEYEDEEYEEVYEEEIFEEEVVPLPAPVPASPTRRWTKPKQSATTAPTSPTKLVYSDIHQAQGGLRKAPLSAYQQRDAEKVAHAAESAPYRPAAVLTAPPSGPRQVRKPKIIRPPPEKGGKPLPRTNDVGPAPKVAKKYPLDRLLARNQNSTPVVVAAAPTPTEMATSAGVQMVTSPGAPPESAPGTGEKKKKIIKRLVRKKKPVGNVTAAASGSSGATPPKLAAIAANAATPKPKVAVPEKFKAAPSSVKPGVSAPGGPFKRRVICNVQPSPPGEETLFEKLLGPKLITNPSMSKSSTKGCLKDQELIGLYVAANWKSGCKRFGPLLKDFYYNAAPHNNLEIVYISADRSLAEFKDFYTTTPFLAMPAGTSSYKNEITKTLKIIEMPALVILDEDGDVVTVEGVQKIQELERGNVEQANQLVERWKKTRPIPMADVQKDNTLLHGTIDRGFVYWN